MANETRYNVVCERCEQVFQPPIRSPLWWQAKRYADAGFLSALCVSKDKCGCVVEVGKVCPDAPYRVLGFTDLCEDFDIPFYGLMPALQEFRELNRTGSTVFIKGVSPAVLDRLMAM